MSVSWSKRTVKQAFLAVIGEASLKDGRLELLLVAQRAFLAVIGEASLKLDVGCALRGRAGVTFLAVIGEASLKPVP